MTMATLLLQTHCENALNQQDALGCAFTEATSPALDASFSANLVAVANCPQHIMQSMLDFAPATFTIAAMAWNTGKRKSLRQ